jgi:multiple sugar transport system substrate-binding protein
LLINIRFTLILCMVGITMLNSCNDQSKAVVPVLNWYIFDEPSGAFSLAARRCSEESQQAYKVSLIPLPADTDQQREQLVRRLAAGDTAIDIIGMDVIWTAEFAQAGWILPWTGKAAEQAKTDRLDAPLQSASYQNQLWGAPFTTNIHYCGIALIVLAPPLQPGIK